MKGQTFIFYMCLLAKQERNEIYIKMIEENYILDYEQVLSKLEELTKKPNITKENDIGKTKYGLPISCYSIGEGDKAIVVTGATHGSEIITTDFILKLMENLADSKEKFNFKIYFIPMLNPEGYLITSSAIRTKLPRKANIEAQEKFAKEYYLAYKDDDLEAIEKIQNGEETDRLHKKRHQQIFDDIDTSCIPNKYQEIRNAVSKIFKKYPDLPKGSLVTWSANADGIDLQANSRYNPSIEKIKNGEKIYKDNLRHSNINISHPGPINCPYDLEKGFEYTKEIEAINKFLDKLNKEHKLQAFYNFHSTGGVIYQRPIKSDENEKDIKEKTIENYFLSKIYSGIPEEDYPAYKIEKNEGKRTSTNDSFRMMYPIDLLIELSKMGGNPLGPYGDNNGNYKKTIESNIKAFTSSMKVFEIAQMLSSEMKDTFAKLSDEKISNDKSNIKNNTEKEIKDTYDVIDMIYDEFNRKIKLLEENKNEKCR